jgi:outer membrane protein assembly factor BamB
MRLRLRTIGAALICFAFAPFIGRVQADDWPQFRGVHGTGVSESTELPTTWGADKNVAWKVKIPGSGWSSPIVSGNRVFVTTAVGDKQQGPAMGKDGRFPMGKGLGGFGGKPPDVLYRWEIHCLDATSGKTLWQKAAIEQKPNTSINPTNTYATETPVSDGERVYAYFGMTGLFCFDFDGKLLWAKDLGFYPIFSGHGSGGSPVLDDERLFVQCDNQKQSFLVALDKRTGKELWRVARAERSTWTTPLIWKTAKSTAVVCSGNRICAYEAETGKVLWEMGGFEGQHLASPTSDAEHIYVGVGGAMSRKKPLAAIRPGASGDLTPRSGENASQNVAWFIEKAGPPMASLLAYQGYLYILDQTNDFLNCYDAKSGKLVYRERLPNARGFFSSPWANKDHVFCLDQSGRTFVVQAGPVFRLLKENDLNEQCAATPAIANGAILVRTVDHLYCLRQGS